MQGYRTLLRSYLRRDRWLLPIWILGITALYYSQAPSIAGLYPDQSAFDKAAASVGSNPAFIAMAGPARALNTIGGMLAWKVTAFGAIAAGLMGMFLVGRHTRAEEESGRDELVRAAVVGRPAPMVAAFTVAAIAQVTTGLLVAGSLIGYGMAAAGSIALGLQVSLSGLAFSGIALLAAQLTSSTRAAYGLVGMTVGLSFVLRAIGDVGNGALSWLSPIGWGQAMRAFSGERWWPALLLAAVTVISVAAACAVFNRRDIGSGLLADRTGPANGKIASVLGLVWRLDRTALLWWAIGLLAAAAAYGSIGESVQTLLGGKGVARIFTTGHGTAVENFYASILMLLGMMTSAFVLAAALRLHGEENAGRAELLLASAKSRTTWWLAHTVVAVAGVGVLAVVSGCGLAVGFGLATGEWSQLGPWTAAALTYVPPTLVLAGVAWLLIGWVPRWSMAAWAGLVFCVAVMMLGPLLRWPDWVQQLSPYFHVAAVPAEPMAWTPIGVLTVVGAALWLLGLLGWRRRDVR